MPILTSDLIWHPASLQSDSLPTQNGGRADFSRTIVTGVKNNLFQDVTQSQRTAGATHWRKAFLHNNHPTLPLLNPRVYLDALTPAEDCVVFYPGTQTDTQDGVASRAYGIGVLAANAAIGATSLVVQPENPSLYSTLQPFKVGDLVWLSGVVEEFVTVAAVDYTAPAAVVITLTAGLINAFSTGDLAASVFEPADVAATVDAPVVASTGGTFSAAGNLVVNNAGAVEDVFTLTFTDATHYSVAGVATGAITPSGTLDSVYAPINPNTGAAYFSISPAAFGGSFSNGDTISFATHPACIPLWFCRTVPSGAGSLDNDLMSIIVSGESA